MVVFPNAKLNLGLNIIERRPDGLHNLESVFYPLPVHDALEGVPADEWEITYYGNPIQTDTGEDTVKQALNLLEKHYSLSTAKICLLKQIPQAAGLAGGSSDGAFTLSLLNNLQTIGIQEEQLTAMSQEIGSDCPFFMTNKPTMVTGKGDLLAPISLNLSDYHFGVVVPDVAISTKTAYQQITPGRSKIPVSEAITYPIEKWPQVLYNDFEAYALKAYPHLKQIKSSLYEQGAIYASMTGSGSAFYGIFRNQPNLSKLNWPEGYEIFEGLFK